MTRRVIHLFASVLVFAAALWWVSFDLVLARLQSADPVWLFIALLALTLSTFSMARRWQITAQALDLELPYRAAVKEYYLALAMNSLLPGGVVGDVRRAIRLRGQGDLKRAAQSVMAERLIGQGALLAILVIGLVVALVAGTLSVSGPILTTSLVVLVIAALVIILARTKITADFLHFCGKLLARLGIAAHALLASSLLIFALYACARATGTSVPVTAAIAILPLVLCAMLIPLSVAGWGWREGAAAALFPLFGASPEAGIAMGICYGAIMLLAAFPGVTFVLSPTTPKAALDNS